MRRAKRASEYREKLSHRAKPFLAARQGRVLGVFRLCDPPENDGIFLRSFRSGRFHRGRLFGIRQGRIKGTGIFAVGQ